MSFLLTFLRVKIALRIALTSLLNMLFFTMVLTFLIFFAMSVFFLFAVMLLVKSSVWILDSLSISMIKLFTNLKSFPMILTPLGQRM